MSGTEVVEFVLKVQYLRTATSNAQSSDLLVQLRLLRDTGKTEFRFRASRPCFAMNCVLRSFFFNRMIGLTGYVFLFRNDILKFGIDDRGLPRDAWLYFGHSY